MKNVILNRIKKSAALLTALAMMILLTSCKPEKPEDETINESTLPNIVRITFPEGSTVSQIALLLEENGVCPAAEFMACANDTANLEGFDFEIPNPDERAFVLEGYVFPDTYDFYRNEAPQTALRRFLKNADSKFDSEIYARCDELGYTMDEILTLASIVQEEAGNPSEMGKVSSVIHNRLESSRFPRLQCDVATFYLRDYVKPYVEYEKYNSLVDLYNTYNCKGLPAGPITNVGMDAINAALYPEDTDYYYFVTDQNGNYLYAETWEGHLENCDKAGL